MLSFARIASDRPLSVRAAVSIALISFLVALASFYFVEQPFRKSRTPAPRMLIRYAALLLIALAPGIVVIAMKGIPQRRPQLAEMEAGAANIAKDPCLAAYGKAAPSLSSDCVTTSKTHTLALIGDSHAAALAGALRPIAEESGYGMDEIGKASCPPLYGVTIYMPNHPGHDRECAAFNKKVLNYIRSNSQIHTVVMAGFWSGPSSQPEEGFSYVPLSSNKPGVSEQESLKNLQEGLEAEVEQLRASGKQVILIKDAPALNFNPLRYEIATVIPFRRNLGELFAPELKAGRALASEGSSVYSDRKESAIIDDVAGRYPGVRVYDLKKALCQNGDCAFIRHGSLLYVDANHLSQAGAEMALARLDIGSAG